MTAPRIAPIAPVKQEITVAVPQARAFQAFTANMDAWYPRQHHIGQSPLKEAVLECKPGGRWYEVGEDGTQCEWGKVLLWEPPSRVVLAWQLNAEWKYDPDFITEVEVSFTPQGEGRTLVTLEHRNLDRFGAAADEIRKSIGAPEGWPSFLVEFAKFAVR